MFIFIAGFYRTGSASPAPEPFLPTSHPHGHVLHASTPSHSTNTGYFNHSSRRSLTFDLTRNNEDNTDFQKEKPLRPAAVNGGVGTGRAPLVSLSDWKCSTPQGDVLLREEEDVEGWELISGLYLIGRLIEDGIIPRGACSSWNSLICVLFTLHATFVMAWKV